MATLPATKTTRQTRRFTNKANRHATRQQLQSVKGKVNINSLCRLMEVC